MTSNNKRSDPQKKSNRRGKSNRPETSNQFKRPKDDYISSTDDLSQISTESSLNSMGREGSAETTTSFGRTRLVRRASSIGPESDTYSIDSTEGGLSRRPSMTITENLEWSHNAHSLPQICPPLFTEISTPTNKHASQMLLINSNLRAHLPMEPEPEPVSSTANVDTLKKDTLKDTKDTPQDAPKNTRKDTRTSEKTSSLRACKDTVSSAWNRALSLFGVLRRVTWVSQAPVWFIATLSFSLSMISFLILGVGFAACHYPYLSDFSICQANIHNPLCSLPDSSGVMTFCPAPTEVNTSELFKSTYSYLKIINISEEASYLPWMLSDHVTYMKGKHEDVIAGESVATEIALLTKRYIDKLEQASRDSSILNHQISILTAKIHLALERLSFELPRLETQRPFQRTVADHIYLLFGVSVEHSAQVYSEVWIKFFSQFAKPVDELFSLADNLEQAFIELGDELKRISLLSEAGHEQQKPLSPAQALFAYVFGSPEDLYFKGAALALYSWRDASQQTQGVVRAVRVALLEVKQSNSYLMTMLRRRRFINWEDTGAQTVVVAEALAKVKTSRENAQQIINKRAGITERAKGKKVYQINF